MDLNYTKKELSAVSGFSGLCLGLVVAAGVPSLATVAIGGLISIPMIGGFLAITDGKRGKKYSELESKFLATVRKSRSMGSVALVDVLKRHSEAIASALRIHKITAVKKLEIDTNMIVLTFRREPALKDDGAKLLAGTAEEFLKYVVSHPIRYRLIADPGVGKTPTTAVMLSAILVVDEKSPKFHNRT